MRTNQLEFIENVRTSLKEWKSEHGKSDAELARHLQVSAATISQAFKNPEEVRMPMWNKIADRLGMTKAWQIFTFENYEEIHNLCRAAQEERRMLAISAKTGLGKTTALKRFKVKSDSSWYVHLDCLMTKSAFVQRIQKEMGITSGGTTRDRLMSVVEKLKSNPGSLLILDDVCKLDPKHYRLIQVIYDLTESNEGARLAGIILSGTEKFHATVTQCAARNAWNMPEFMGRIGCWLGLNAPSKAAIETVFEANGITDSYATKYFTHERTGIKTFRELYNVVQALKRYPEDQAFDANRMMAFFKAEKVGDLTGI
jgi:transcriptional regulator with XRE-family HTH domain